MAMVMVGSIMIMLDLEHLTYDACAPPPIYYYSVDSDTLSNTRLIGMCLQVLMLMHTHTVRSTYVLIVLCECAT